MALPFLAHSRYATHQPNDYQHNKDRRRKPSPKLMQEREQLHETAQIQHDGDTGQGLFSMDKRSHLDEAWIGNLMWYFATVYGWDMH